MIFILIFSLIFFYTSGIQQKLKMKTDADDEINHISDILDPVEMKQIHQLLIVLGGGIVLAGIIFLFEISCMVFKKKPKRKPKKIRRRLIIS